MKRNLLLSALLMAAMTLSACGARVPGGARGVTSMAPTPVRHGAASTAQWGAQGDVLRQAKAAEVSKGSTFANSGDWAYQSDTVDLTGDGEYTFRISVGADFVSTTPDVSPLPAFAMSYPPDTDFEIAPAKPPQLRNPGTEKAELLVTLSVQGLTSPYPGYSIWIS